jgi:hypothetical protein
MVKRTNGDQLEVNVKYLFSLKLRKINYRTFGRILGHQIGKIFPIGASKILLVLKVLGSSSDLRTILTLKDLKIHFKLIKT